MLQSSGKVCLYMFVPIQDCEIQSFYLWLKGRLSPRQRDDLAPVFICCPDERKRLVLEFCDDLHAQHRIKAFLRYFRSLQ